MHFKRRFAARSRAAFFMLFACVGIAAPAAADIQVPRVIGWAGFGTNDWIGDGDDRWRTGSYGMNLVIGRSWKNELPKRFGELMEFRLHGEVISPDRMHDPDPSDRDYAGILTFGAHSQFARGPWEWSVGADLVVVGPQTQLHVVHAAIHEQSGGAAPTSVGAQVPNSIHVNASVEVGRSFELTRIAHVRPFVAAQAGHESLVRAGVDFTIGLLGTTALMSRDPVTGIRYPVIPDRDPTGLSLTLGADIAHVSDSVLLPESRGYQLSDNRHRLRAGLTLDTRRGSFFAGVAWLGPEFVGQPGGQRVGALTANFRF